MPATDAMFVIFLLLYLTFALTLYLYTLEADSCRPAHFYSFAF
jgi:hypothetical protein